MDLTQEKDQTLLKTAQLYHVLHDKNCNSKVINAILKKGGDINYQIPADSFFGSIEPQLIGGTSLHIAAFTNNIELFNTLLSNGADFTIQNQDGNTILHYVIEKVHQHASFIHSIFSAHIEHKIITNPRNNKGMSHFHIACLVGNIKAVEYFLDNNVSVDEVTNSDFHDFPGSTPLHIATTFPRIVLLTVLLNRKANVYLKNAAGTTALDIIVGQKLDSLDPLNANDDLLENNFIDVIEHMTKLLLDSCNVDELFSNDNTGLTYFQVACTMEDSSLAERLIEQIANLDYQIKMDSPMWPGYSALHFAACCNMNIVEMLLDRGANPNIKDAKGVTPLDILLQNLTPEKMLSIIELKESWKLASFLDGKTNLFNVVAAMNSPHYFAKYLNEDFTDINTRLPRDFPLWPGYSILHLAVLLSNDEDHELTLQCLDQAADVTAQDSRGRTPLILAFRLNKMNTVNLLFLYHHVKVNIYDDECLSHLHIACVVNNTKLLKRCKRNKIQKISIAYEGQVTLGLVKPGSTPLHVAIAKKSEEMIEALLNHHADCQVKDTNGLTPIDWFLYVYPDLSPESQTKLRLLFNRELDKMNDKDSGLTWLHVACCFNYENTVKSLLAKKVNIDTAITCEYPSKFWSEYVGCTPLHLAILTRSKPGIISELISKGTDILAKRPNGMTPVYDALVGNYHEDVRKLITTKVFTDADLLIRLKDMSGITNLHIACICSSVRDFFDCLREKTVDVNARVNDDCKIWPGCTALHLLLKKLNKDKIIEMYLFCLFSKEADVTIKDANGDTPIHLVLKQRTYDGIRAKVVNNMLNNQKDFNVNPVGSTGISHFHAACIVNNFEVVKKFIDHGVDVNKPVDLFAPKYAGKSPLDLAINLENISMFDIESLEWTVDLLLYNGAKTSCEDCYGDTVFHKAVLTGSTSGPLLKKLARYETDNNIINKANTFGITPLKKILQKNVISTDIMFLFMNRGCRLNAYDFMSEQNYISYIISDSYHTNPQIKALEALCSTEIDEKGAYAIHHIVDIHRPRISTNLYLELIKKFDQAGIDVNSKDGSGLTPLHIATKRRNILAIDALLKSSADINIVDPHGRTALVYVSEFCKIEIFKDFYEEVFIKLASHVKILEALDFEVSRLNRSTLEENTKIIKYSATNNIPPLLQKDLDESKNFIVDSNLTLRDFISDYGPISNYPFMAEAKRARINERLQSVINGKEFVELKGFLKMQRKKAVERMPLVNSAIRAVRILFWLECLNVPYECIVIILGYIRNSDVMNLIDTMDQVVIKSDELKRTRESDDDDEGEEPKTKISAV